MKICQVCGKEVKTVYGPRKRCIECIENLSETYKSILKSDKRDADKKRKANKPKFIYKENSYMKAFPEIQNIFHDSFDNYKKVLQPLFTIELKKINPDWFGSIHMLAPIEPFEGCLGENSSDYHNYYTKSNWIGFKVSADSRYSLIGDFNYFDIFRLNNESVLPYESYLDELKQYYKEQNLSYQKQKRFFKSYGKLRDGGYLAKIAPIEDGNWATTEAFPGVDYDLIPLSEKNRKFHFIASCEVDNYRDHGADQVLMFYEPVEKIVLFTFEWS